MRVADTPILLKHAPRSGTTELMPAVPVTTDAPAAHAFARWCSPTTSGHSSILSADLLAPFAMYTPLACSDYYGASAPPPRPSVDNGPARHRTGCPAGRATGDGSHVHQESIDEPGARLNPTASPRLRRKPSAWPPHRTNKPAS